MNIYTRNGDFGYTTDIKGNRISKSSLRLNLQGGIDEVNSAIGFLRSLIDETAAAHPKLSHELNDLASELKSIQHSLFELGTEISTDFDVICFMDDRAAKLETAIDRMLETTGELHHFLCLGGTKAGAWCHSLRSITRRAERDYVAYLEASGLDQIPLSYRFINRLADYFFQLARYLNHLQGVPDETF